MFVNTATAVRQMDVMVMLSAMPSKSRLVQIKAKSLVQLNFSLFMIAGFLGLISIYVS